MPSAGHSKADPSDSTTAGVLDQDVGCPGCGYNLRGLGSGWVICPECGERNDVAALIVRRWDKPWYKAPKYSQLCMPAAALFLSFLGWVLTLAVFETVDKSTSYAAAASVWLAIGLIGWSASMMWVWNRLDQHISAGFALLVHLSILGYIGGIILILSGAGSLVAVFIDGRGAYVESDPVSIAIYTALLLGGIFGLFVARLVERVSAKHCIRLYLRRPTTSD